MNVEKEVQPTTWKDVIVDFFENRISETKLFKAREYVAKKEKEILSAKDTGKKDRLIKARDKKSEELIELRKKAPSTEVRPWIDKVSKKPLNKGKRTIKVTHALKFSNSSSAPEGLCSKDESSIAMLTTNSMRKKLVYDLAHSNGNLISISRFLSLKIESQQIIDLILENDFVFLEPFAEDSKQLDVWKKGFESQVEVREIRSAEKAKQIYFPKKNNPKCDEDYDLIIPLFSSSLAEEIYLWVTDVRYGEEQKKITAFMRSSGSDVKASKYHCAPAKSVLDLGVIKFGGAQPQNISMLNKNRGGRSYLLSTQPPIWKSQLKPPVNRKSLFDDLYNTTIKTEVDYLRDFLIRFNRLDLSIKDPRRKRHLERWVNNIIDEFLFYIATIQNLPSGWSDTEKIRLKREHQYLLDPYCINMEFQSSRQATDWQAIIRADFALWLNRQLRGKDKQFTARLEHTRQWKKQLEQPLRVHMEPIELEIKKQVREIV